MQNLNQRDDENSYAEVESAMKEQALKEIKALREAEEKKLAFNIPNNNNSI